MKEIEILGEAATVYQYQGKIYEPIWIGCGVCIVPNQQKLGREVIQEIAGFIAANEPDKLLNFLNNKYTISINIPYATRTKRSITRG